MDKIKSVLTNIGKVFIMFAVGLLVMVLFVLIMAFLGPILFVLSIVVGILMITFLGALLVAPILYPDKFELIINKEKKEKHE